MAVYELNDGKLLRVARSINGNLEQEYFSLIGLNKTKQKEVIKQAKDLDKSWAEKQINAKAKRTRDASTDKKHSTGVRGINIVFRPSPAFRVQVQLEGKSKVREFSIRKMGDSKAWSEATKYLASCRGYKAPPKSWKERIPKIPKRAPRRK